jgi:hypothetical protein
MSKNKFEQIVALLGVPLFFLPKVNLISFAGESAGLRVDDVIILLICLFIFIIAHRDNPKKIVFGAIIYILVCIISNFLNIILFHRSNFLYSVRFIEYYAFFYVGYFYAKRYKIITLVKWYLLISAVVMVLQKLELLGGFSSEGYVETSAYRAIGLTGGPWEVGAILNFVFCILIFDESKDTKPYKALLWFAVTFVLILFTGARMPTVAHLLLLLIYFYRRSSNKLIFMVSSLSFCLVVFVIFVSIPNPVLERSEKTFSYDNIDQFAMYYKSVDIHKEYDPYSNYVFSEDSDLSWLVRVSKWSFAIKLWINTPLAWFFGVGPGTWGAALDGGWVRLITETGMLGLITFLRLFREVAKPSLVMGPIIVAFFISMIMIDINFAYKAMSFLLFTAGYYSSIKNLNYELNSSVKGS